MKWILCAGCGQAVRQQRYLKALGRDWHADCFLCSGCGKPITGAKFLHHERQPYHTVCYHRRFSPMCQICGGPVRAMRYVINGWKEVYCHSHLKEFPACFSCGRLTAPRLTGGGVRYQDGRIICRRCQRTATGSARQAVPVFREVHAALTAMGMILDLNRIDLPIQLVGQDVLNRLTRHRHSRPPAGMARVEQVRQNGKLIRERLLAVLVLYGLPREHCATVLAHELCHVWIFYQKIRGLPLVVEEGLCTLVEYLWLKQQNTPESTYRIALLEENRDPLYGEGFRNAKKALETMPFPKLLDFIRQRGRMPFSNPVSRILGIA